MTYLQPETRQALYSYHDHIANFAQFKPTIDGVQDESFKRFAGILTPDLFSIQITLYGNPREREYTVVEAREAAEMHVSQLHQYGLQATMERQDD